MYTITLIEAFCVLMCQYIKHLVVKRKSEWMEAEQEYNVLTSELFDTAWRRITIAQILIAVLIIFGWFCYYMLLQHVANFETSKDFMAAIGEYFYKLIWRI